MSRSSASVDVRPSLIHGVGLFAVAPIHAGELILEWDGVVVPDIEASARDCFMVDGRVERVANDMRWLNHSDVPSAEFRGVDLFAARAIAAGEEITIRYSNLTR